MITLNCDRCEKPIQVEESLAGKKVQCPECGDVNLVPVPVPRAAPASGPARQAAASDRATARGLPPDSGPEQRVARIHPAMFRARPLLFTLLLAVVLGGAISAVVFFASVAGFWIAVGSAAASVAALLGLGVWKVKSMDNTLTITNKRIISSRGLLSKATSEIGHENIQNIQITQSVWKRVWGVGRIGISSSGQSDVEIVMDDVPKPYEVRDTIDLYRNSLR